MDTQLMLRQGTVPKTGVITTAIASKLLAIFKNHIGVNSAISKEKLFQALFGHYYQPEDLKDYLLWDFTRKAMTMLRTKSNCFVISKNMGADYFFWVAKTDGDAFLYVNRLNKNITKIRWVQARAVAAVDEKWYKQQFMIEERPKAKQLKYEGRKKC